MAARRLILVMILLLILSSAAAALVPVNDDQRQPVDRAMTVERSGPSGELFNRTLRAGASKPRTLRIAVGDQLVLQVTSKAADQVEIPGLGEMRDVDRDAPARFDLLPFEAGSYPVRLIDARRRVGRIVVTPQRDRGEAGDRAGESSSDSPGESTAASTAGALLAS